jgi:Tfp pilus assembly protein PilF
MDSAPQDARLSNYRLERLLGAGGMGSVYLAHDLVLDRAVAIKFIVPERAADDSARRRLIREARAAAALEHPNICSVHEVIVDPDGRACIVMQYVEGETLAQVLRRGPLDVRLALTLTADLASALAAAHARGIIHRDLKPQNIIVTPERHAKLLDFGIARQTDLRAGSDEATATSLTGPGAIVGTPAYMSPEQAQQLPLDGRTDLFTLGAVLFECLTGRRAFEGDTPLRVASQVLEHDPPPVSSLRPELSEQHDELCRRLLAKHPDDRFTSADELLGALRVLMPGTTTHHPRTSGTDRRPAAGALLRRPRALVMAASLMIFATVGIWKWSGPRADFEGTPEAMAFYERGTGWIRAGAYDSGRRALDQAVALAPGYVPAYVALAEARSELDDHRGAQNALLKVDALVPDESQLADEQRLRLRAVRSAVLRDLDSAIEAYRAVAARSADAGALVDLGRAQEAAALTRRARTSYEAAIAQDQSYAAAHLRLAGTLADHGDGKAALESFRVAEDLFRLAANSEGQTEAVLRRGVFLSRIGQVAAARQALEHALALATPLGQHEQGIRAQLALSSVMAWEGRFKEAQTLASTAVDAALDADMDTVAAEGLIELANVLFQHRGQGDLTQDERRTAIDSHLDKAVELAGRREARRTLARAALVRASVIVQWGDAAEALRVAAEPLKFLRDNGYRRSELTALNIVSRAHERLGEYAQARSVAESVLEVATRIEDEVEQTLALENLAGQATAVGSLPDAAAFRKRSEDIHRKQKDLATLPYDLTNRAELLIRMGRTREADELLREVAAGIAQKIDAYMGRARRAQSLRALSAAVNRRFDETVNHARPLLQAPEGSGDAHGRLAARLLEYAEAEMRARRVPVSTPWMTESSAKTPASREVRYWEMAGRLASGDARGTLEQALATLSWKGATLSPEFEWRIAALGAAAARAANEHESAAALTTRARDALTRVRQSWNDAALVYLTRPDLVHLQRKAEMN